MTNSNYDNNQVHKNYSYSENTNSNFRGKFNNKRESGGFRIRLSDNEMKSVKTIQENFQLKSTVAVLGFSVRTLSELIKDDNIREQITKLAKNNKNSHQKENTYDIKRDEMNKAPNPFARPEKKMSNVENKDNIDEQ